MAVPWAKIAGASGQGTVGWISALVGANNAGDERKKMDNFLNQQDAENKAWYNANALSDYTQRADAQNLMRQLRESLSKQNQASANMAVVTGATPEQQAVQKELSNKVISDTYSNLGAMGQQYKDSVVDKYQYTKRLLDSQRMGMMDSKATAYENLFQNGMNTFGDSFATLASM
ncbi:MAG: hypothetical protein LBQ73_09160 [Tannerellaceae bacterium]|jgi:hypothetical protein|nr:hypothetical protein [Tannerellaceae bacterium]